MNQESQPRSFIDRWAGEYVDTEELRRARLIFSFTLFLGVVGGSFGVVNLALISWRIGTVEIVSAVFVLMAIPVLRLTRSTQAAGHYLLFCVTLVLFGIARLKGGLVSTVTVLTPAIVFIGVLMVGRMGGLVWAAAGTLGVLAHLRLDQLGMLRLDKPLSMAMYTATAGASFFVFWGFAHLFESSRRKAFAALEQKNVQLAESHQEVLAMSAQVQARNDAMRRVLDNVAQGFITVGLDGRMESEHSRILDKWFSVPDPSMPIWSYIGRVDHRAGEWLALGMDQVTAGVLPLELTLAQLPQRFTGGGRTYSLTYIPIRDGSRLDRLLIVVTDLTDALEREAANARQQAQLEVFRKIAKDRGGFMEFIEETNGIVGRLDAARSAVDLARDIHTIKGNSAIYGADLVASACHHVEQLLVDNQRAAERDDLLQISSAWETFRHETEPLLGIQSADIIEVCRSDLDEAISIVRSRPPKDIERLLVSWTRESTDKRLRRIKAQAEGIASRLNKSDVRVEIDGNNLRLNPDRWSPFWSAFVHVLRNSLDHGLENVDERRQCGKPEQGLLRVSTYTDGDEFVVDVMDDGRGINWDAIARKAASLGLPTEATHDLHAALFTAGVSTKDRATELSGRGVGMAAIKSEIDRLRGHTHIITQPGRGTTFQFRVPRGQMA